MTKILETKRLILREWEDKDTEPFAAMNQDPEVMKFFPSLLSYEESLNLINRAQQQFKAKGFCLFAVELKATHEFIGFVGLSIPRFQAHFIPCVEIGWRIAKKYWNQGYATEAAKLVLHEAFEHYGLNEVVSFTAKSNKASIRIMEKIGLYYDPRDEFNHPNLPTNHPLAKHVLYRLSKAQLSAKDTIKLEAYTEAKTNFIRSVNLKAIQPQLQFVPLSDKHFPLLLKWLETPHVKAMWDTEIHWTIEKITEKYCSYVASYKIEAGVKKPIYAYIIQIKETPIGYIQFYNAYDFKRDEPLDSEILPENLAALDFYLGEPSFLNKGVGSLALSEFIKQYINPHFQACFVDPDRHNLAAIQCYKKAGFKIIKDDPSSDSIQMIKIKEL